MAEIILNFSLILYLHHVIFVFFMGVTIINCIKNAVFMVTCLIIL